jgi:hypothetical protein
MIRQKTDQRICQDKRLLLNQKNLKTDTQIINLY